MRKGMQTKIYVYKLSGCNLNMRKIQFYDAVCDFYHAYDVEWMDSNE